MLLYVPKGYISSYIDYSYTAIKNAQVPNRKNSKGCKQAIQKNDIGYI